MIDMGPQTNFNRQRTRPYYKKPVFYIGIIALCVLSFGVYAFGSFYKTIVVDNNRAGTGQNSSTLDSANPMPSPDPNRLAILILGNSVGRTDGSVQDTGALLTDGIELLVLDKPAKQAALVSLPRDLHVETFGASGKINEAYVRGGIPLASEIVSRITGVYVDKTVVFDINALKTIINNINGLDIHLDAPFSEPTQWTYPFSLPAGNNHLNGDQVLYYVRSRDASDDFDRSRRQQQIISALKIKLSSLGILNNPLKMGSLILSVKSDIKTDFNIWDINSLISVAGNFIGSKSSIKSYVISTNNLVDQSTTGTGVYILTPKGGSFDGFRAYFKNIFNAQK